ncbi:MAG: PspC domain-containing protein [Anaerolineae bacterium]|nr:PspC domain-containing protein [Anaerolineae bacterium]
MRGSLRRSRTDAMLGGVCVGLARFVGIDVTLIRIFFVLLALGDGAGVWLYLILWLIVPLEGEESEDATLGANIREGVHEMTNRVRGVGWHSPVGGTHRNVGLIIGVVLIVWGSLALIDTLNIPWLWWLNLHTLWPVLLIVGGAVMMIRGGREESDE